MSNIRYPMPEQECPQCHTRWHKGVNFGSAAPPRPGDITVCIKCTVVLVLDETLHVRMPSDEELRSWPEAKLEAAADARLMVIRLKASRN